MDFKLPVLNPGLILCLIILLTPFSLADDKSACNGHNSCYACIPPFCSCPSGFYNGFASCCPCQPGMYCDQPGNNVNACYSGTYNDRWCMSDYNVACKRCPPGTFSPNTYPNGVTSCTRCSVGTHSTRGGSSSCDPCPSGTVPDADGINCIKVSLRKADY